MTGEDVEDRRSGENVSRIRGGDLYKGINWRRRKKKKSILGSINTRADGISPINNLLKKQIWSGALGIDRRPLISYNQEKKRLFPARQPTVKSLQNFVFSIHNHCQKKNKPRCDLRVRYFVTYTMWQIYAPGMTRPFLCMKNKKEEKAKKERKKKRKKEKYRTKERKKNTERKKGRKREKEIFIRACMHIIKQIFVRKMDQ